MKLTIHVTASGAKRLLIVGSALIVLGTAAAGLAALPDSFKSGDRLTAASLTNDFGNLDSRVTQLESSGKAITVNAASYSRSAVFAKATPTSSDGGTISYDGKLPGSSSNGWVNAKVLCETTVNSASAHMCTGDELVRSEQLGISVPNGWYAATSWNGDSADTSCNGWTDNTTSEGAYWYLGYPSATQCNHGSVVLCCN